MLLLARYARCAVTSVADAMKVLRKLGCRLQIKVGIV